jgi:hypothetical protein
MSSTGKSEALPDSGDLVYYEPDRVASLQPWGFPVGDIFHPHGPQRLARLSPSGETIWVRDFFGYFPRWVRHNGWLCVETRLAPGAKITVLALDAGEPLWGLGGPQECYVVATGAEGLVVAQREGGVLRLTLHEWATGSPLWTRTLPVRGLRPLAVNTWPPALIEEGQAWLQDGASNVWVLEASSGQLSVAIPAPHEGLRFLGRGLASLAGAEVGVLHLRERTVLWTERSGAFPGQPESAAVAAVLGDMAYLTYAGSHDGRRGLAGVDLWTGHILWVADLGLLLVRGVVAAGDNAVWLLVSRPGLQGAQDAWLASSSSGAVLERLGDGKDVVSAEADGPDAFLLGRTGWLACFSVEEQAAEAP